ncbi:MAG: NUDIX domain-containing protein [Candidatus Woesearchaeota archaeon]
MEVQRGVSAIIYDKRGSTVYFLILHRKSNWKGWEFPKGKIEAGETPEKAIMREIEEETGLNKVNVKGKLVRTREYENNGIPHTIQTFLVEANMNINVDITKEEEHDNYLWTTREGVLEKLYWPEERSQFEDAIRVFETNQI